MKHESRSWRLSLHLGALAIGVGIGVGCGSLSGPAGTPSSPSLSSSASLSSTFAATTQASGTLVCAPGAAEIADCAGKKAGDACALVSSNGQTVWEGACAKTLDGTVVACAPKPVGPPAELVDACSGLAAGAACTVTDPLGATRDGVCVTALDGSTLLCGRPVTPPAALTQSCEGKAKGDACTLVPGSSQLKGVCSFGPFSTGTLACTPARDLVSPAEKACVGLAAGASCAMGKAPWALSGTCVVPASGDPALCVLPCPSVSGQFDCDGWQDDGGVYPAGQQPMEMFCGLLGRIFPDGGVPPGASLAWDALCHGDGGAAWPTPPNLPTPPTGAWDGGLPGGSWPWDAGLPGGWNTGGGSAGAGGGGGTTNTCVHHDSRCAQACTSCH